jgi:hypothetical protein
VSLTASPIPANLPSVHRSGNDRIPRPSRRRSPEAPARARRSPQGHGEAALLSPVIPAYSGPARTYQDRPVTPEVAGSSPVAPVENILQMAFFCCPIRRKRPPVSFDAALIPQVTKKALACRGFRSSRDRSQTPHPAPRASCDVIRLVSSQRAYRAELPERAISRICFSVAKLSSTPFLTARRASCGTRVAGPIRSISALRCTTVSSFSAENP